MPGLTGEASKSIEGMTIKIDPDGEVATLAPGHASSGKVSVLEATSLYVKFGEKKKPKDEAYIYDISKDTPMLPSKLKINNDEGILPTYLKQVP